MEAQIAAFLCCNCQTEYFIKTINQSLNDPNN